VAGREDAHRYCVLRRDANSGCDVVLRGGADGYLRSVDGDGVLGGDLFCEAFVTAGQDRAGKGGTELVDHWPSV